MWVWEPESIRSVLRDRSNLDYVSPSSPTGADSLRLDLTDSLWKGFC